MPSDRCLLIPNGYDEEDFKDAMPTERSIDVNERPFRLLHAGVLYPDERDPKPFFRVLSRLKREGWVDGKNLSVDLRASGSEQYYSALIGELQIEDLVHLLPALPYGQALQDCAAADALLLFQAASCNHQIPAKVYEYLRFKKPILALTSHHGDTAALLRETGGATIIDASDEQAIYSALCDFLNLARSGTHALPDRTKVERYGRKNQTVELAGCLSQVA
jgi:glycosyltransferase involved in cell wall biosynthesis